MYDWTPSANLPRLYVEGGAEGWAARSRILVPGSANHVSGQTGIYERFIWSARHRVGLALAPCRLQQPRVAGQSLPEQSWPRIVATGQRQCPGATDQPFGSLRVFTAAFVRHNVIDVTAELAQSGLKLIL